MGGPARATVLERVIDLEHQRLLAPHAWEIVPAVLRIILRRVGLADAIGVAALRDHEVFERDAARVADRQRKGLNRMPDRPPHLDDGEAAAKKIVSLV